MFSCPRCSSRFEAGAAPSALICPRCRDEDGVLSPLTFWIFDPPAARPAPPGAAQPGVETPPP
jgi:hypothetical protein